MAWKNKWFVLRRQTAGGSPRLECYRSEVACLSGQCKRWISLKDITSVAEGKSSRTHTNIFEILVNKNKYVFSVESLTERAEWISMIKDITLLKQMKDIPIALKGNEYENEYELFKVTVMNTKDSERLQIVGDYYLSVEPRFLCLHDIETGAVTTQWNLQYLPRFNLRKVSKLQDLDMILVIWASRDCKSRHGEYHFLTREGKEIMTAIKMETCRLATEKIEMSDESARSTLQNDQTAHTTNKDVIEPQIS
ncbi:uncharacterized protein LOC114517110 isoform X2 [Dendronephthya gigantea]|uniref:uncharacterized protein LOC114517110 isoform X2 n=1 Tax=Dendronephthya gigantea TaxID=151771 RepID=UPI00106D3C2C|nr:uncharacterized protein LOC114517110 isoform X2 [Dendronephthya gigantea]